MKLPSPPKGGFLALSLCAFACTASVGSAQDLSALSDFNVILTGNFSTTSEVEGRTLVGGNFTSRSSSTFGTRLQGVVPRTDLVLRVKGNIDSGSAINLNAGSLEVGGSVLGNRRINFNGGGSLVSNPSADFSGIFNTLTAASSAIQGLTANSTGMIVANMPGQPGPFVFNANPDASGLAVFSIDGASTFGNGNIQNFQINPNNAADILINVSGRVINWNAGDLIGNFDREEWQERIVFNFFEATTINFGGREFSGQILAPNASITTNGVIEGSVFAKNLTTQSELHLPGFNGTLIPEPSSALLSVIGATALLLRRKRAA